VLLTVTDKAEHRRRLEGRVRGFVNLPEPTWDEVLARAQSFEPWSGDHEVVNADRPLPEVIRTVLSRLGV
jgi:hypothetical protein